MNVQATRHLKTLAPLLLLLATLLLLAGGGSLALAQGDEPTPTAPATNVPPPEGGPLSITAVQPGAIANDQDVEIVVTGTGFDEGATVVLNNYGGLETTFVSRSVLRALVRAGIPAGTYKLRVVNPDAETAEFSGAVAVTSAALGTATPVSSATPAPTAFVRPLLVVQSYGASAPQIAPGQNLDFEMTFVNAGQATATNVVATFVSGDFVPRDTGGVRALGNLGSGQSIRFWQPLYATADISGKATAVLKVTAGYTDINGQAYTSDFELTFPVVRQGGGGVAPTATPTATPTITPTGTPRPRPQLLVTDYETDPVKLQPGGRFVLTLNVQNQGESDARNVTLIVGGGSAGAGGSIDGTPTSGGVTGGGGQFSEFAPIGSSNVSAVGNLPRGESHQAAQSLIVNTTTKSGAYPVKVSFVYTDNTGASYVDDQIITLLVYQDPQVVMNFYAPAPVLFAGEPGGLPLQLLNTGRNSAIFGNFSVKAEGADLSNNTVFVGALEPGGFFPLDALITANQPGTIDLELSVSYVDDFNQQAVLTNTLSVEVMEGMPMPDIPEGGEGLPIDPNVPVDGGGEGGGDTGESIPQRIWRFILGLLGLGSDTGNSGNG